MKPFAFAAAALVLIIPASVAAQPADPAPIRDFDVETIQRLGREIYEQDRFAWVGTDALLAAVAEERLAGTIGWIVVERDGADVVRFGRGSMEAPEPSFDITFRGDAEPVVTEASGVFSENELAMFRGVALARTGITQPCSNRYNSVVLPDPDGDGWLIWMFAATTQAGVVPVGGHYRFTVSQDGRMIEQADRLSRSCLTMDPAQDGQGRPEFLVVTHIVSDTPVEAHVFLSLSHGYPIVVATPDRRAWMVEGDQMSIVETDD